MKIINPYIALCCFTINAYTANVYANSVSDSTLYTHTEHAQTAIKSDFNKALLTVQNQWTATNYNKNKETQKTGFTELQKQSTKLITDFPDRAEAWIWHGIVQSSFAGVKGGLGALSLVDDARYAFEQALSIDESALQGSAHTSLGILYLKVPGWPISFGDDDESEKHLKTAIKINPKGIDINYFLGEFYVEQKDYQQAKEHLLLAQSAPKRVNRENADKFRQQEIAMLLTEVNKVLTIN